MTRYLYCDHLNKTVGWDTGFEGNFLWSNVLFITVFNINHVRCIIDFFAECCFHTRWYSFAGFYWLRFFLFSSLPFTTTSYAFVKSLALFLRLTFSVGRSHCWPSPLSLPSLSPGRTCHRRLENLFCPTFFFLSCKIRSISELKFNTSKGNINITFFGIECFMHGLCIWIKGHYSLFTTINSFFST